MKTALIIGATGLVGNELLKHLLNHGQFGKVITISRKPLDLIDEKLEQHVVNFEELYKYEKLFNGVETVFCALGTTMKKAGTKEQFVKVDFEYPLKTAQIARKQGVSQFFIVTAMGANQHSPFFYNQVKGNIEAAIKELNFPTLYIIRPSLILGNRHEQRIGEDLAQTLTKSLPFLFKGPMQKYKPNEACAIAKAMHKLSLKDKKGVFTIESKLIEENK